MAEKMETFNFKRQFLIFWFFALFYGYASGQSTPTGEFNATF
jgi:hypothetical protein